MTNLIWTDLVPWVQNRYQYRKLRPIHSKSKSLKWKCTMLMYNKILYKKIFTFYEEKEFKILPKHCKSIAMQLLCHCQVFFYWSKGTFYHLAGKKVSWQMKNLSCILYLHQTWYEQFFLHKELPKTRERN